jgi:hypothetical protein
MRNRSFGLTWLLLLTALWGIIGQAHGSALPLPGKSAALPPAPPLVLDGLAGPQKEMVREVVEKATLVARGPGEAFHCKPEHYYWFLDHPDRAVTAWRRLGARCVSISPRGQDSFGWSDDTGSEVVWETVFRGPGQRIWLAEGKVKPGPLLPAIPVKVVMVLRHNESKAQGNTLVYHQTDLYIQTDSKSANIVAKMLGNSAQRLAEQGLGQFQLFFAGLSWYLDQHPDMTEALLKE